ncbi:hypothetical protein ACQ143_02245 [Microbacterium sp. MC2]
MSTPDQPDTPQLTRRQLRELRNTASTPIITADTEVPTPAAPPVAPLPRAAEPVEVPAPPAADETIDLNAPALTRRQARLQEKLRTASVPVITPEVDAAEPAATPGETAVTPAEYDTPGAVRDDAPTEDVPAEDAAATGDETAEAADAADTPEVADTPEAAEDRAAGGEDAGDEPDAAFTPASEEAEPAYEPGESATDADPDPVADTTPEPEPQDAEAAATDAEPAGEEPHEAEPPADEAVIAYVEPALDTPLDGAVDAEDEAVDDAVPTESPRVLGAAFGAGLLVGGSTGTAEQPPSFDQLLTRSSSVTGSLSVPNALILSQTPEAGSLVSPITATGEVLITGAFSLPENYGATGRAPGTSDGKEIDATLVDGELPPASSPTPIAASSAISTIKSAEDIIKPPAPEKGSRLMMALAITAGVLALALAGVLIVALATGVFR